MRFWNHCENPYPFVPVEVLEQAESARASLPNRYCDPQVAARLYDEVLEEYQLCDELGINIDTNEHHGGINNLYAATHLITSVVARLTSRVRILSMGTLVTVRPDPVRVAEEYATLDVLSRGRLEIGFVKSGGTEMASGNANPMRIREREWEAIDLIDRALTSHDGPFSWQGRFFEHEHVNIWPRPWQQPRPEFWGASSDLETCVELGRRGYVNTLLAGGFDRTRKAFEAYARGAAEAGRALSEDRLSYSGFAYVADTDAEAMRTGEKVLWFLNVSMKQGPQYERFLPGAVPPELAPQTWRGGRRLGADLTAEAMVRQGQMFCGNPDTVARQIRELRQRVGGLGELLIGTRWGLMTHAEAMRSYRLFATEVMPQLEDLEPLDQPVLAELAA